MSESESRAPRAFFFFDNSLIHDNYLDKCKVEKIAPGFGDIVFTNSSTTYFAYGKRFERLDGTELDTCNHLKNTSLEDYYDVISTARKNHWRFKIIVSASDPSLCDYINEQPMPSWSKAKITVGENGYKVKIWFSELHNQPRWLHSRKFIDDQISLCRPESQSIDFMTAFCLCLGEWKSLLVISETRFELRVGLRSAPCVTKFGRCFEMPRKTLLFDDYMWAYIWFLPSELIEHFVNEISVCEYVKYKYLSSPDAYVMLADTDGLKLTFSTYDYKMKRTREKFFHDTIVDVYLALAPFNVAVYEMLEVIQWLPYMENAVRFNVVRTLESLFASVQKVYKQREEKSNRGIEALLTNTKKIKLQK